MSSARSSNPHDDIEEVLIDEAAIQARVRELGAEIASAYGIELGLSAAMRGIGHSEPLTGLTAGP